MGAAFDALSTSDQVLVNSLMEEPMDDATRREVIEIHRKTLGLACTRANQLKRELASAERAILVRRACLEVLGAVE